jgi:hypothetical protein
MQWLRDPSHSNVDNINDIGREACRHRGNKTMKYLKANIDEHETKSKIKNIRHLCRGINDFKMGYQTTTNSVKDKKCDLVSDSHSTLAK